jgi:hypothetical protein
VKIVADKNELKRLFEAPAADEGSARTGFLRAGYVAEKEGNGVVGQSGLLDTAHSDHLDEGGVDAHGDHADK